MSLLAYSGDVAETAEQVVDVPYLQVAGQLEEEDRAVGVGVLLQFYAGGGGVGLFGRGLVSL